VSGTALRFAGEFAALGTACCWAVGSNLFAAAGRRIGSRVLNRLRITFAMVLLGIALLVLRGSPWPAWATPVQVALLAASGLVGFVFGDTWGFRALVILGPGRGALLAALAPLFTAAIAWPLLGERPGPLALLGMALTLAGVAWVLQERRHHETDHVEGSPAMGVLAGVLGALGQAGGYVLSKIGMRGGLDALSATMIRVVAATAGIWLLTALSRETGRTMAALRDRRATWFAAAGAAAGPFLGVTLSLYAVQHIQAGVAASITACSPVLAILIATRFQGERLTARYFAGAVVAVAGVVVLFLR
jgi:drug/metabolite transporter (DMT)-like permease